MQHNLTQLCYDNMEILRGCFLLLSFVTVSGAEWTTPSGDTYFTCAFEEDDICGFEQMSDDNFDWAKHRGGTATRKTGPSGDHTTGTGYYMYIETSAPSISVARLSSPSQLATGEGFCLEFYYHMYGTSIGTLNVFLSSGQNFIQDDLIFTRSDSQGNRWWQSLTYFNSPSSHWRIIFEGRKGQGSPYGDIAIDDVSFIPGPCPTQEPFDQYGTPKSFPDVTPWGDIQGIRIAEGTHLKGQLEVLYAGEWGTICGRNGDYGWGREEATVACRQLGFVGWSSTGYGGYIGYDDRRIWMSGVICSSRESYLSDCQHDGFGVQNSTAVLGPGDSCSHFYDVSVTCLDHPITPDNTTCTFEEGTCGFYDLVDDDFDWTRHQGSTLSTDTGPSGDHTTGTGYYMYVETSSGTTNWKARLASASYVGRTYNQGLCISFYYHMFGSSIGTLKVIYQTVYNTQKQDIVTLSGDHGNIWLQESVHFSSVTSSDWMIIFEATRGSSHMGDIAIDDVSISQGPCPLQDPKEEDVILRCASSSFQVDIPKNLIEGTYVASDFYLSGDPDNSQCKGFYNGAWYISLNSSLTECGTQFNENGPQLHYQNMVEIDPSDGNSVVDFLGVEIPITCEYNSSKTLQTHFKTLNDVIRKQERGSFEFDFAMYTDTTYSTRYDSYPVETNINEELYFRAELLRSASNLEIHLRSCRATPSPDYDDTIVYEFISAGCGINDAPVRVLTPYKHTQADFEITSFRFRKDLSHPDSQIWIHCEVVVCDVSDANSECRQGCEQSRHRRSAKSPPLKTKRMVQGPIVLSSKNNDNSDIAVMSQNKDGSTGLLTTFLSAVSLVMMMGLVTMTVVLRRVIRSSKQQRYQPLPNP